MKLRSALAAVTVLASPIAAHAQPVIGPYVSLGGGTSLSNSYKYKYDEYGQTVNGPFGPQTFGNPEYGKFLTRPSYSGEISAGYGFGYGVRVELEGNYYRNTIHKDDNASGPAPFAAQYGATGGQATYGAMGNIIYDLPFHLPIYPYVGAGAGYEFERYSSDLNDTQAVGGVISGTEGSFAYQLIGGLSYPVPFVPGLSLTADYRFMQLTTPRNFRTYYGDAIYVHIPNFTGETKIGRQSYHTVMVGLRYQIFNPPPPAPMPTPMAPASAPAPSPAKTYLVFFDWDKYSLTPRATEIIAQAASDSKTTQVTTIEVSGYTDTSGTPNYNMGLSNRRAQSVAAQLVTDGVPASEIETHGFGETHLLVPTGPGVREPQNRRVEIILN